MPSRCNAQLGDIIRIEVPGFGPAIAKVLFASKRFKDVMLVGIYHPAPAIGADLSSQQPSLLLYTATTCARKQPHWEIVDNQAVRAHELALSERVVAGEVWLEDCEIRAATPQDRRTLPEMGVLGYLGVEAIIRDHFTTTR